MIQAPEVALEDMNFEVVYRPESTSDAVLTQEQLVRDLEGWHSLVKALTDENSVIDLDDKDHIVVLVQEALSGAFEEFKKALVCQCTLPGTDS